MRERSRSPPGLGGTEASQRVARALDGVCSSDAALRPAGLEPNAVGAFLLRDLMRYWGKQNNIGERELLHALCAHMVHEGQGRSQLRFAVDCDADGNVTIQAFAKQATISDLGSALPKAGPPAPAPRQLRGSVLLLQPPEQEPGAAVPMRALADSGPARSSKDAEAAERAARVHRSMGQMGLSPETVALRQAPRGAGPGERRYVGESVQRWLGWALQAGYEELGVHVAGGWAALDELVAAMQRSRPDLGRSFPDAASLKAFLEETDDAGRFEFDADGRLRKVAKGSYRGPRRGVPQRPRPAALAARAPGGSPLLPPPPPVPLLRPQGRAAAAARGPADSTTASADVDADDAELAQAFASALHVSGLMEVVDVVEEALTAAPPQPPGEHWTKYQDGDEFWWHYDGPLGVWWCAGDGTEPTTYES